MVGLVGVHGPDVFLGRLAGLDIVNGLDGGCHGVIHVVVAMLAVAAHAIQVAETVKIIDDLVDTVIRIEVGPG